MNHAMAVWPRSDVVFARDREQHEAKIRRTSRGSTTHTARLDGVAGAWSVCSILRKEGISCPLPGNGQTGKSEG